ncbi:ABC transporter permease [Streptococcus thermophilus]|uniref:Peptide-4 ABC exporter (Pep4E) family, substrate binding/membrane-spanning protein n=1 Tax=Streptococcus thermophilus (strain ATCC BAA-250 / LMG 18311) TaxID=264199 RepID=Q5M3P3_STRT2|nr:ABC transporter permease [Streptococcus thermophilus]AAV60963.1 peptide-4 ABC exporter (Pep4E) family, substrate binding/membrane-spanning protein [Streptococcus thermophilus LMG 18311]MCT2923370.1 ABC transporter permease [Streptococcus thermophilus]MCT2930989.1 ABC transporter permease [Streptococcus thermophilus]MCT2933166.1 ABC transporter permease [Streptococcus thermophilus]MCT2937328.1 ABC transporter permease [Streptococcus thermophilus]
MFRLTNRLVLSNLIKNRKLYYPYTLATILVIAITYIFTSLTLNSHLDDLPGADAIKMVLGLGLGIVALSSGIIVLYANSFVMKNRSKELGLYSVLGLEKRHLFSMILKETMIMGFVTLLLGIGVGALFDKLIYAFLQRLIGESTGLVSTFQVMTIPIVLVIFACIFSFLVLVNGFRLLRLNPLQLTKDGLKGEKKGRFLVIQTFLGLGAMGYGYYLALSVQNPVIAIMSFFLAVLLVILGTYLLFNAGTTVVLQLLKKKKSYYYKPNNMISISNLVFRMKKNAVGLATIAILSSMVLVTLVGAASIYAGKKDYLVSAAPHDYSVSGNKVDLTSTKKLMDDFLIKTGEQANEEVAVSYLFFGIKNQETNKLTVFTKNERKVVPKSIVLVFSQETFKQLTGKELNLSSNQIALYTKNKTLKTQKSLSIDGKNYQIHRQLGDFINKKVPNIYKIIVSDYSYLVVPDIKIFESSMKGTSIAQATYVGVNVKDPTHDAKKNLDLLDQIAGEATKQLAGQTPGVPESYFSANSRYDAEGMVNGFVGGTFFIGIFLSIIFMLGTVLVIYYKQISEGYEDRERFVILQKIGLDDLQVKQTIRKQVLTVFFLPLIFAFIHLAFAYHMISLIVRIIGVLNPDLMLVVTIIVCGVFFLAYILVFVLTSRSYRRIVSM